MWQNFRHSFIFISCIYLYTLYLELKEKRVHSLMIIKISKFRNRNLEIEKNR